MARHYLYMANPLQAAEIVAGAHNAHHQLPPPGMTRGWYHKGPASVAPFDLVSGRTSFYVDGEVPPGTEGDWYWSSLGSFVLGLSGIDDASTARLVNAFSSSLGVPAGAVLGLPIFLKGQSDVAMRWIRTTLRGTLAGVEQFQHKLDWGHPGADPSPTEAEGDTIAATVAAQFAANWGPIGPSTMGGVFSPSVQYTEVGIVLLSRTTQRDKDGGGDPDTEEWLTRWYMWPEGEQPIGLGANPSLPFEVSCALTLQTDHRGPSGRGRTFMPPFYTGAMANAGMFNATCETVGTAFGNFVDGVKTETGLLPVVVSPRRQILNEVTSINVGHVPDSQRRRRKSQAEARTVVWSST